MAPVKILLNDSYFSNLLSGYVELDKQQFSLSLHAGKNQWSIKVSPRFLLKITFSKELISLKYEEIDLYFKKLDIFDYLVLWYSRSYPGSSFTLFFQETKGFVIILESHT